MSNSQRQTPVQSIESAHSIDKRIEDEAARVLFRQIVFMPPDRMVYPPSWLEHVPFAFWLIEALEPRVFVELGTHSGNSYAAFAQAVQHLGLDASGYAIDTWKGDPQAGFYDESVFTDWKAYHDGRYSAFSALIRSTFDDALEHFPDGGIDLLNIDGYHTTDAVTHDFNTWLPKMSARGVVLMHDINVREGDFGAWRAWQEFRSTYPSFEFLHGHGLGVLATGTERPAELDRLLSPPGGASDRSVTVRQFFARAGGAVLSQYRATTAEREAEARASSAKTAQDASLAALKSELDRQMTLVTSLSIDKGRAEERSGRLQEEIERRGRRIDEIESASADSSRASLEQERSALESLTVLRAELDRQTLVTSLSIDKGRAEERSGWLQQEIDRRGQRIDEIESARAELERLTHDLRSRLEAAEARAAEARDQIESYGRKAALVEADRDLLVEDRRRLQREVELAGQACRAREEEVNVLAAELSVVQHSRSWRLTAPLRGSRRLAGKLRHLFSTSGPTNERAPAPPTAPAIETLTEPVGAQAEPVRVEPQPETRVPETRVETAPVEYVPLTASPGVETVIKAIAFYLPQFHPIPENDQWWGKGFTEWHNVVRGRAQFAGHYQPHVPGELGFYDLRMIDVQRRQIELAKAYGLHGFCYHHYWFAGRRLLRRPLDQLLANADLDFPFCLCWANENWTRRWDGLDTEILIAQEHSPEHDVAFIRDLEPALRDSRYIRVDGRSLVIVYRPTLLPDARATAERWREYCRAAGLPDLFLVSARAFDRADPRDLGFDAAVEFAPNNMGAPRITTGVGRVDPDFAGAIYDYSYLVERSRHYAAPPDHVLFRCVAPTWDNEARRPGRGTVFAGSSPALYREWLENACRYTLDEVGPGKPFVFINAWNEWAEGAHLEPDREYGYAYLQATADALRTFPCPRTRPSIVVVSHDAYFHGAQRLALALTETLSGSLGYDVDVLLHGEGPLKSAFEQAGKVHDFFSAASTPQVREQIVRNLYDQGARVALCNTSCVGDTVELLKKAGFRVASMIHELPGLIREYGLEASIDAIAREADRVVFPAGIVRDRFIELTGMALAKAVVRPQGLLRSNRFDGRRADARRELRSRLGLGDHVAIVLAVGFADRRKGIDLFVDVGLDLHKRFADTAFVWVGHHEADAFGAAQQRVADAGAQDRFFFPGLVSDADVFFAGADAYLMTSREDPFPLVVLDALDAELPVVGFDGAGGFVELLRRDCGILVPYLDTSAMAEAVWRLLTDPSEGQRLSAAGKAIIAREFSFVEYARDLVQLAEGAKPRISVIVPNYNYAHYLPARLRSILAQTLRPHEIIFLDDCSSDTSVAVAEKLLKDTAIPCRIIRNETNQGVYRQWLRGLREATGDLVWIAEADDQCSPTLLEKLAPAFGDSNVVLAYCQSKQIDGEGRELAPDYLRWTEDVNPTKWRDAYVRRGTDEIRDSLIVKNTIPNVSAVLMKKPDLSEIEAQLVALRNAGDWLVYVHLLERGDLAYFPEAANSHRRHRGSVTIGHGGLNLMREILLVERHILDRHPISSEVERKREEHLQATYEVLGLQSDGPVSYKDHHALNGLTSLAG